MSEKRSGLGWESFLSNRELRSLTENKSGYALEEVSGLKCQVSPLFLLSIAGIGHTQIGFTCSCLEKGECRHVEAVEEMLCCEDPMAALGSDEE